MVDYNTQRQLIDATANKLPSVIFIINYELLSRARLQAQERRKLSRLIVDQTASRAQHSVRLQPIVTITAKQILIIDKNITSTMSLVMDAGAIAAEALTAKIITMVCLFAISMVVGCIPLVISLKFDWFKPSDSNLRSSNQLVMGMLAFGGGVLFATTFMHLLPEVDDNIELLQEAGELPDIPLFLAGLIMCGGFFMMYLIEELVHLYIHSRETKKTDNEFAKPFRLRKDSSSVTSVEAPAESTQVKEAESETKQAGHSHLVLDNDDDSVVSALRGLLIVLALSIHELFEGLAVGLESSVGNVWYMFGAVSAHKYIIAFCIGVELLASGTKRWLSLVYIFTFSFMSALGIGVGILLVGGAGAADAGLYSVVLQGLACGTLVYVVFFEVWKRSSGLLQFVCALLGFALMVTLELVVELAV